MINERVILSRLPTTERSCASTLTTSQRRLPASMRCRGRDSQRASQRVELPIPNKINVTLKISGPDVAAVARHLIAVDHLGAPARLLGPKDTTPWPVNKPRRCWGRTPGRSPPCIPSPHAATRS